MAADAMSGGLKGAFSGRGHCQLGAGGSRKKSRLRELHPRPNFHKHLLRTVTTWLLVAGRNMAGKTRHSVSWSQIGTAWHQMSDNGSWNWCGLASRFSE